MKSQIEESWLKEFAVPYEYHREVMVSELPEISIDLDQIRLGRMDNENLAKLEHAVKEGAELPAVIVLIRGGRYVRVIDGLHRLTVLRNRGVKTIDVYAVNCDDRMLEILQRTANVRHGLTLTRDERISHAIHLVLSEKMSATEAARMFSISDSSISTRIRARNVAQDLQSQGLTVKNISESCLVAMHPIKQKRRRAQVARIVNAAALSADDTKLIVDQLERCDEDLQRDKVIEEAEKRHADRVRETANGKIRHIHPLVKVANLFAKAEPYLEQPLPSDGLSETAVIAVVRQFEKTGALLRMHLDRMLTVKASGSRNAS